MRHILGHFFLCAVLLAAAGPGTAAEMPAAPPDGGGSTGRSKAAEWIDRFFTVAERAWSFSAGYYAPTQSHRDINLKTFELARAWCFSSPLELRAEGGLFRADGTRDDAPSGISPASTATGVSGGLGGRLVVINLGPAHLFAEGSAHILWTPSQPFPAGGTGVNWFLRGGGGLSYDVAPRFAIELGYHRAHVSNSSGGSVPQNPQWNGQGGFLSLRYRLGP